MIRLFTTLSLLLFFGCAHRSASLSEKTLKRSGEFQVHTEEVHGGGSIIFREQESGAQFFFYSPFGQKIGQLKYRGDTLTILNSEGSEDRVSIDESVSLSGLFSLGDVTYRDLLYILSGRVAPRFESLIDTVAVNTPVVVEGDTLFVKQKRGKIKDIRYSGEGYSFTLSRGNGELFRDIELDLGRRNYFQIQFDH